jgi:hypothetical protein
MYHCWIILLTPYSFEQPLHAILPPLLAFFFYLINPYSSNGKRRDLQHQRPWQQQYQKSTTSGVVVGHTYSTFRDHGENAMAQFIGATHRRKTHIKKEEEQC